MSAARANTTFQFGVHMSWGIGLFLGAFCLANFSTAAAMACLGVVVTLGTWISYSVTGWVGAADADADASAGTAVPSG